MSKLGRVIISTVVIVVVLMTIIGGLMLGGSPNAERLRRVDEQRRYELQLLQDFIRLYWGRNKSLPLNLLVPSTEPGYYLIHSDPETKKPYEYRIVDSQKYELCATFSTSTDTNRGNPNNYFWSHTAGRQCFNFDIEGPRR